MKKILPAIFFAILTICLIGCDWDVDNFSFQDTPQCQNCNNSGYYIQDPSVDYIKPGPHDIKMYSVDGGLFVQTDNFQDLPLELRESNWGGGSCVHASTVMMFRAQGQEDWADYWRKTYSGGESLSGLVSKMNANGLTFAYTGNGDPSFLDWLDRTRRWATIFYYPNHSICYCGYSSDGTKAILLDNNRKNEYIYVPKDEFIKRWKGYGGVALTCLWSPNPPMAWVGE